MSKNTSKLSALTIGWGVWIIASASFMLKVNEWLVARMGGGFLLAMLGITASFVFLATFLYAIRSGAGLIRAGAVISIFGLGFLLALRQEYLAEKTHIFTYGLLGFMAAANLVGSGPALLPKTVLLALCFVAFISALDETFQFFLPYRFGEMRDFATNMISGALGISLFIILRKTLSTKFL
ncbi:MAG: VanZ family protein [Candidatus Omnitrophica bacterium]|nr:VanZ family protein [Candidatus Omnitrophota bacterium]